MKKFIFAITLCSISMVASAHGTGRNYNHHGHYGHRPHANSQWLVPMIVSGAIGYAVTRNYSPPPVVEYQRICGPWVEVQHHDGSIGWQRTCR